MIIVIDRIDKFVEKLFLIAFPAFMTVMSVATAAVVLKSVFDFVFLGKASP